MFWELWIFHLVSCDNKNLIKVTQIVSFMVIYCSNMMQNCSRMHLVKPDSSICESFPQGWRLHRHVLLNQHFRSSPKVKYLNKQGSQNLFSPAQHRVTSPCPALYMEFFFTGFYSQPSFRTWDKTEKDFQCCRLTYCWTAVFSLQNVERKCSDCAAYFSFNNSSFQLSPRVDEHCVKFAPV